MKTRLENYPYGFSIDRRILPTLEPKSMKLEQVFKDPTKPKLNRNCADVLRAVADRRSVIAELQRQLADHPGAIGIKKDSTYLERIQTDDRRFLRRYGC